MREELALPEVSPATSSAEEEEAPASGSSGFCRLPPSRAPFSCGPSSSSSLLLWSTGLRARGTPEGDRAGVVSSSSEESIPASPATLSGLPSDSSSPEDEDMAKQQPPKGKPREDDPDDEDEVHAEREAQEGHDDDDADAAPGPLALPRLCLPFPPRQKLHFGQLILSQLFSVGIGGRKKGKEEEKAEAEPGGRKSRSRDPPAAPLRSRSRGGRGTCLHLDFFLEVSPRHGRRHGRRFGDAQAAGGGRGQEGRRGTTAGGGGTPTPGPSTRGFPRASSSSSCSPFGVLGASSPHPPPRSPRLQDAHLLGRAPAAGLRGRGPAT